MAEPLKVFFSPSLVTQLAQTIEAVWPEFDSAAFCRSATRGLASKELMQRAQQISHALRDHLPRDYPKALSILLRSLGPEHSSDELLGVGMAPFFYLPHTMFVADNGLDHFELSLAAQAELTKRFTCEYSIRYFIERDPERAFAELLVWSRDQNAHVRRLASEGTRLRLPWGKRVRWLDDNPERVLQLLERMRDDESSMVRRSVANNLNDLSKEHAPLMMSVCQRWLTDASEARRALVTHALRSAVKRGDKAALALMGVGQKPKVKIANVTFDKQTVRIGQSTKLAFVLSSASSRRQDLLVDVRVHFQKARGKTGAKVFKLKRLALEPRTSAALSLKISLAIHTTRKPHPGSHLVELLVNGTTLPLGSFSVVA